MPLQMLLNVVNYRIFYIVVFWHCGSFELFTKVLEVSASSLSAMTVIQRDGFLKNLAAT